MNSFLSWAFSQHKKIKIIEIINESATFKYYESSLNNLNTDPCWFCSFFLLTLKPPNLKVIYSLIYEEHDQSFINLTDVFDFMGYFSNYVVFDEIKLLCALLNILYTQKFITARISVSELILNAKNLMWKSSGNVFLGHLGGLEFIFSQSSTQKLGLGGEGGVWPLPWYLLWFLWIMLLQYSIQSQWII